MSDNPDLQTQEAGESVPFQVLVASGEIDAETSENEDDNEKEPT